MKTFDMALFDLCQSGVISEEDALRNADSENNLRLRLKLAGEKSDVVESATFTLQGS
jgi:twitching motility protein PilU